MPGLALTDHGVMYGCLSFYERAKKEGINPILGMEAYVAPANRSDRTVRTPMGKHYYHLVLLARNQTGYKNLIKLSSIAHTEGYYYNPRLDREVLAQHNEGIVVLSACLAGEIAQNLETGNWDMAEEAASWYANVFQDRYYLEVQGHNSEGQAELNRGVLRLADKLGLPLVATNDVHFLTEHDHGAHDTLVCIGMGKDKNDPNRLTYDPDLYFKSEQQMAERFRDRPEVLENTLKICEETDLVFDKQYFVPAFPLPEQVETEADLLRKLTYEGAERRYDTPLSQEVVERIEYELSVITNPKANYSGYFLIVSDFIMWAKNQGIPVGPGRGSAAGSIVAYCTGITDLCPLRFDLLFERFLNPDRVSMPDIDVDFDPENRERVIDYVRQKYGEDAVCQIITFGTMKARAVIKDVGRTLGFLPHETDRIAKLIPNAPNNSLTVSEAVEQIPEIRALAESSIPRERELIENSTRLEGLARHSSVHAAGVVIAPGPLSDYIPICIQPAKVKGAKPLIVSQYDMTYLEKAGMLKMDFLGLRNLRVIADTVDLVKERYGRVVSFEGRIWMDGDQEISLDDPDTYALLRSRKTGGVFQFESALATDKIAAMEVDRFEDIVAASALIRPGPLDAGMTDEFVKRKNAARRGDQSKVTYPHPDLEPVLESTLGIITYQEQVMRVAQIMAGYTLAEADILRKAVGKKDAELIKKELEKFKERAKTKGYDPNLVDDLARQIETFGRYGFNRSHSAAYGIVSFQTAYLKAHYPAEFMAALLSSVMDSSDDVATYLAESREMGIPVDRPDVNESTHRFSVVTGADGKPVIRVGLTAIRNVGVDIAMAIVEERRKGGTFQDFFDFAGRAFKYGLNKRTLESLIGAGACDSFGHRAQLLQAVDVAIAEARRKKEEDEKGQESLFDLLDGGLSMESGESLLSLPDVPVMPQSRALALEKELVGFYVSDHPVSEHEEEARIIRTHRIGEIRSYISGTVTVVGVVTQFERRISQRTGKAWGMATLEDLTGTIKVLCFDWERYGPQFKEGEILVVSGRFRDNDREVEDSRPDLMSDEICPLSVAVADGRVSLQIRLPGHVSPTSEDAKRVGEILSEYPGVASVLFAVGEGAFREAKAKVRPNLTLMRRLRDLLGEDAVHLASSDSGTGRSRARARVA